MASAARLRLLLDTHAWLWGLLEPARLSPLAERAIRAHGDEVFLSPVSVWETLVLARMGRISLDPAPGEWVLDALRRTGFASLPVTHAIALRSERLIGFDGDDPADRFLIATALEHDLTIVTADRSIRGYAPVGTIW